MGTRKVIPSLLDQGSSLGDKVMVMRNRGKHERSFLHHVRVDRPWFVIRNQDDRPGCISIGAAFGSHRSFNAVSRRIRCSSFRITCHGPPLPSDRLTYVRLPGEEPTKGCGGACFDNRRVT